MSLKLDSRQVVNRSALPNIISSANEGLDTLLLKVDSTIGVEMSQLRTTVSGLNTVVNIASSIVSRADGTQLRLPNGSTASDFTGATINFTSGATTGNVTAFSRINFSGQASKWAKYSLVLQSNSPNMILVIPDTNFYTSLALAQANTTSPLISGGTPIAIVVVQDNGSAGTGTINNIVQSNILMFSGGGGGPAFTAGSVIFSDGSSLQQDNSNFFWDDSNNRLGIGTASPAYSLDVNGVIRSKSDILLTKGSSPMIYTSDNFALRFGVNSSEAIRIDTSGNVGIGNPSSVVSKLHVKYATDKNLLVLDGVGIGGSNGTALSSVNDANSALKDLTMYCDGFVVNSNSIKLLHLSGSGTKLVQVANDGTLSTTSYEAPGVQTLTYSGSVVWNTSSQVAADLTLNGNTTLSFTGLTAGLTYALRVIQGTGGSRLITWTNCKWPNAVPPVLSTAVGAVDLVTLYCYDGTHLIGSYLRGVS